MRGVCDSQEVETTVAQIEDASRNQYEYHDESYVNQSHTLVRAKATASQFASTLADQFASSLAVLLQPPDVLVHHQLHQVDKPRLRFPAQLLLRFGVIS